MIADAQIADNQERMFMKYRKQLSEDSQVKVKMITTESKVPVIVSFLSKNVPSQADHDDMGNDVVATKL